MQTSFMHPPFGFALFYLRGVAPQTVRTADIYWGAVPFLVIQLCMVGLVLAFPGLVGEHAAAEPEVTIPILLEETGVPYGQPVTSP